MTTEAKTASRKVRLPVEGMNCAGCVRTVEAALRAADGVEDATVAVVVHLDGRVDSAAS